MRSHSIPPCLPVVLSACAVSGGTLEEGERSPDLVHDLASDPGETVDLHRERPDVALRPGRLLESYRSSGRSFGRSTPGGSGDGGAVRRAP